jgi:predicted DNA-binding transcriptional regulator AlpA
MQRSTLAADARTPPPDPILLRIPDACRISGLSRSALYKLNRAEQLKFRKFGRTTLVDFVSLKAAIAALPDM